MATTTYPRRMPDRSPAVAILTWRGEATTRACLQTLVEAEVDRSLVLLVDNGSGTGEGARLAAEFGTEVVTLPDNGGVAAGYNAAIRRARERGASHVLLANNDLEFRQPDLLRLLQAAAAPGVAAVGPVIRNGDGSVSNAGGSIDRWLGLARRATAVTVEEPHEVGWLDGSCLLVSIEAVCAIGGLSPDFFLYWEETDWCARSRRAGYRLLVNPSAEVVHVGWASGSARQTRRFALRNSLLFLRRNVRGPAAVTSGLAWLFGRLPWFVVRRLREGAGAREVLGDARWALAWHVRSVARDGWRLPADGPDLCR